MSWHTNQLKYAVGVGGLVTFYGLVSMIIFVAGQQFNLNLTERVVIIAVVLLTLPFALVIGYFATRPKKKADAPPPLDENQAPSKWAENGGKPQKIGAPSGKYEELSSNADLTFQFLKNSNLSGLKGADAFYALPFFAFAGAPRSGKTSLVLSSGLNFQTLPNQRQSEQIQVRPTRNMDWRITSDAVLLDTAGRYQTEGELDADEWSALLETLKKHRGMRPLDGLVIVANVEKLMSGSEVEIEQQAKVLRARLDEAMQRLRARFPVYLVFTHADAIEGFSDSFSVSQQDGKNFVLGSTFPLEKAVNGHTLFDGEFDVLQQNLLKRRLMRLSAPFPPLRQLRILNFPAHFAAIRRKLGHFVATLFRPNPFNENPLFRGFYFTAAVPQTLQSRAAAAAQIEGGSAAATVQTVGNSFFAEKFFKDVLLRDKNLSATFQASKQRAPILGWLLLVFGAGAALVLLALSIVSLFANQSLINDAATRGQRVLEITKADKGRDPLGKNPIETRTEIEALENLRQPMAKLDEYERRGAPLWMRLGLYSGNRILTGDATNQGLFGVYSNAIEQRYKKPAVKRIEEDLQKFASNQTQLNSANLTDEQEKELGKYYDLLKAYLMLSAENQKNAEPTFLTDQLENYWKQSTPAELEPISKQQLAFYATQIDRPEFPRISLDKNLVDAVRKRLQAYPPVFRYYKRVTTEINKKFDSVSVKSILAGRSAGVFEGTATVPGSYTFDGYHQEMKKAIASAQSELSRDDWVMGASPAAALGTTVDINKLQERYFNDYTDYWRKFVRDVTVAKITNKDDAVGQLKALSSTESPMEILLKETARNTNLSAQPKASGWWNWITSFFQKADAAKSEGTTEVEREFKPLFAFVGDSSKPDEPTPISKYRDDLRKLVGNFENKSDDQIQKISKDLGDDKDTIDLNKTEKNVNNRTEAMTTLAGQEIAELLKKPLQNLRDFFGGGVLKQLEKEWRDKLLPKAQEIEKGYPFADVNEADLQKITAFLNPTSGTLSKFYVDKLEKYFEEANGQFKVKESSDVKFSPEFVQYLNNAFRLRQALFGANAAPNFEYEIKLQPVKDGIFEVSIDGQPINSGSTSSGKFKFPAQSGETGALLQLSASGAAVVSTLGTSSNNTNVNSSANSSAPAVNGSSSANKSSASTALDSAANQLSFSGQWGLFRMIDNGSPQKTGNGEYNLTYKIGNKPVSLTLRPAGGDLFDKTVFRSIHAPDKLLKP